VDLGLEGKRALVTGSTAGIGLATARLLAAEGASVVVNGRTESRVAQAVDEIRRQVAGAQVSGVAADLGGAEGCQRVFERVREVDILVNNVGIFEPRPFEEIGDADWLRFFAVNVMSGVRMSRYYLAGMRARDWGRIVFVSSESGLQMPAEMIHYGMTKTAQIAVARGIAETTAGSGVTVNSVLPGRPPRRASRPSCGRWPKRAARTSRLWSGNSSPPRALPRSSSALPRRKRWHR